MKRQLFWIGLGVLLGAGGYGLAQHRDRDEHADRAKPEVLLEKVLAEKLDGQEGKVTLLVVEKAPGEATARHRHPGAVVGYVLEGELESQVEGQRVKTYKQGEAFYEPAGAVHAVSRNPSKTKRTRFLAFLLSPKDAKQLVLPEKP